MHSKNNTEKIREVLRSGTITGVLSALLLILLFILAATFLKSLAFGLILAYFCLPLEKFYEQKFFQWKWINAFWSSINFLAFPFLVLQKHFCGEKAMTEEELREKQRKNLVMRSTSCTVLTVLVVLVLAGITLVRLLIPYSAKAGNALKEWAGKSPAVLQAEKSVIKWAEMRHGVLQTTGKKGELSAKTESMKEDQAYNVFSSFSDWLRPRIRNYVRTHQKELTKLMFTKGKGVLSWLFSILASLGTLAFDLLMSIVFFYFFLQKMALFINRSSTSATAETIGSWCVRSVFSTPWLPQVSRESRQEASAIIDRIAFMLKKWARGYLWIMIIEIPLYMLAFSLFSVPYGLFLAIPSGMTILLPCFGLLGNVALSVTVCLIFCGKGTLLGTLAGVLISYLIINGILEQLFLYPTLVGSAIGLTLLETLVVVLLGGMLAGIPGMILAVPAAAVIKYLSPKIYSGLSSADPEKIRILTEKKNP